MQMPQFMPQGAIRMDGLLGYGIMIRHKLEVAKAYRPVVVYYPHTIPETSLQAWVQMVLLVLLIFNIEIHSKAST